MLLHFYIAQFLNTFLYVFCLGVMPRKFWPFHSHKVVLFLALNSVSMLRHFDIREGRTVFQMATQLSQYNFLNKSFWNTFKVLFLDTLIQLTKSFFYQFQTLVAQDFKDSEFLILTTHWKNHLLPLFILKLYPFKDWREVGEKIKGSNQGNVLISISY